MRKILLALLVSTFGCSSTSNFVSYQGMVNHNAEEIEVTSHSNWFSNESVQIVLDDAVVDERGDFYLETVIRAYPVHTDGFSETENANTGLSFRVKSLDIKNGFTLNIPDPGPVYKLFMDVDIYMDGVFVESEEVKTRINMASVINEEKIFNWLSSEEKNDSDNQITTLNAGLTRLYQKLYFKHLDIDLNEF